METTRIDIFKVTKIRKILYKNEWWFAIVDIIALLTESNNPQVYWRVLKKRIKDEGANETVTKCNGKMPAPDGKIRKTDYDDPQVILC